VFLDYLIDQMQRDLRIGRLMPFVLLLFLLAHCSDVNGIKDRYLAERMFYRANKLYQNIQVNPRSAGSSDYKQARESFRRISVKYSVASLRTEGHRSEKLRGELLALTGTSQMNVADLFFQEGQFDSAIVEYHGVVRDHAAEQVFSSRAQYYIGLSYQNVGKWGDAVSAFDVLLQNYPPFTGTPDQPNANILRVPVYIAQVYREQGEIAEADRHFQKAREYLLGVVQEWPNTLSAQFAQNQIVSSYLSQERWREAIIALEPLVVVHGDSIEPPEASFTMAGLYQEKLHNPAQAMKIYTDMLEKYPNARKLSRVHLAMGKIHLQRGALAMSREKFKGVIFDFPEQAAIGAHAQYYLALTYEMEGEWDKALNEFRWILDNYPNSPEALQVPHHIMEHYIKFSDRELANSAYSQALRDYDRFIAKNPDSPQAVYGQWYIALCHEMMEKWEDAIAALEVLVENYPQSSQVLLSLLRIGEMYEIHLGQPDEALKAYGRLVEKSPRSQLAKIVLERMEKLRQRTK
jgi:tetratricopeptide (TPR) repeat protein